MPSPRRYAHAFHAGGDACGTDSRFPLDGRWSLDTCVDRAYDHFRSLNAQLNKGYTGFTINTERGFVLRVVHLP